MSCEHAFSLVALRCLASVVAVHDATARGDFAALHQMRIAVTCLKSAVAFFAPMVADDEWLRLKDDIRWLNSHLGAARDLDVVIGQITPPRDGLDSPQLHEAWSASHAGVAVALRSDRFNRLIGQTADWIQGGHWRLSGDEIRRSTRVSTIADYARQRLGHWQEQILRKGCSLVEMDTEARHRLRIKTKRVRYATEWFGLFLPGATPKLQRARLKQLRRAQSSLGELNDAERARTLFEQTGTDDEARTSRKRSDEKSEARLIKAAQAAFEAIAALSEA